MPIYNLIKYSDIYSKTSGSLWQYYRDEPTLDCSSKIIDFTVDCNNSISFKFKEKVAGQTGNSGTKNVETMVLLKYLGNFWRILEIPLHNCKISLMLT